ncbi:hypothetical protein RUM43_011437 [Polyplax serrata]|uniref:VWFC domain-containing protein n=1 Tax=Polyplax serrata TaxID=468196 RepID=A0AAN8NTR1_POLSC
MKFLLCIFLVTLGLAFAFASGKDRCPTDFTIGYFYREIGCKPVYEEASNCPSHFDCSNYRKIHVIPTDSGRTTNVCTYKGTSYEIGTELSSSKVNPCVANCRCVEDYRTGHGVFTCASVECFDWHLEDENCTRLYNEESCCSVKTHCKGDEPLPTCLVDGKVYLQGQKFYPNDEPCKECYCQEGFEGKFEEPFCKNVACNVELHYASRIRDNCVPVYYGRQGCCPIDWKCPKPGKDQVVPNLGKSPKTTTATCKFGDLEFQQHDELNTTEPDLSCKCLTPPYLTCTSQPQV